MTPKRQNEIWAMLPSDFKKEVLEWNTACKEDGDEDTQLILHQIFGKHNLTAQAEEKPKEPRFKIGDKVIVNGKFISEIYDIDIKGYPEYTYHIQKLDGYYGFFAESDLEPYTPASNVASNVASKDAELDAGKDAKLSVGNGQNCEIPTENGISDSKNQSKSVESVEIDTKEDAYFAYRLDLAKEIAVAMINNPSGYGNIAMTAVDTANKIVKRLKETEI